MLSVLHIHALKCNKVAGSVHLNAESLQCAGEDYLYYYLNHLTLVQCMHSHVGLFRPDSLSLLLLFLYHNKLSVLVGYRQVLLISVILIKDF